MSHFVKAGRFGHKLLSQSVGLDDDDHDDVFDYGQWLNDGNESNFTYNRDHSKVYIAGNRNRNINVFFESLRSNTKNIGVNISFTCLKSRIIDLETKVFENFVYKTTTYIFIKSTSSTCMKPVE